MNKGKKEVKSSRLKNLEKKFKILDKTVDYIEQELFKHREEKERLRTLIRKEKEAIYLAERAKKLRSQKR